MKKLTKKELQEIENERYEKISKKIDMIANLKSYYEDIKAVERVYKIQNKPCRLTNEEKTTLLNRYENIKDLSQNKIDILRMLIRNEEIQTILPDESIWVNDIIWKETDLIEYVEFLKEIGMTKIHYTNKSTNALEVIVWLTRAGAKVIGTTSISQSNEGLLIEL